MIFYFVQTPPFSFNKISPLILTFIAYAKLARIQQFQSKEVSLSTNYLIFDRYFRILRGNISQDCHGQRQPVRLIILFYSSVDEGISNTPFPFFSIKYLPSAILKLFSLIPILRLIYLKIHFVLY